MLKNVALWVAVVSLSGCSTDSLFVGTYTRVGIDASQDGAGGGIGVKNVAMTIAPTKANGQAYDVLGTTDVDLAFSNLVLSETVATGEAAVCASGKSKVTELIALAEKATKPQGPLIFVASTSWSLLEVSLGEATGPGISFGYRRTVGIRMPIKNETIGSTFASVSISTVDNDHGSTAPKTEIGGTRSVYTFATGKASVNMAQKYASKIASNSQHIGCPD
ncbi:hypothetical protein ACIOYV_06345 [Pseudomonas sp. NPDC087342]|uniref:hypothetical protein n=1 Tax=Pseudomonas sp. NPDC087342 TaxID=3364437 RepID=UPI00380694BE